MELFMVHVSPSTANILQVLTKSRLQQVARHFGINFSGDITKEKQLELFNQQPTRLEELVYLLGRDELRAYCKKYGLDYRLTFYDCSRG